jgi:YfiH family protein
MPPCRAGAHFAKRGDVYRCIPFERFAWLAHGFSTRNAPPPRDLITLRQVHSSSVRKAADLADRAAEGDALVSNEPGVMVGVRTADCVPILLVDPETRAVAAIHAGWRGTAAEIVRHAVEALHMEFGAEATRLHAAIGPSIRVCCYEVGAEVARQFRSIFPEWETRELGDTRTMLDLVEANRRTLAGQGVPPSQIYDSGFCTVCCPEEFHSYRRDPQDRGRMVAFIGRTQ